MSNVINLRPPPPVDPLVALRDQLFVELRKPAGQDIDPVLLARIANYVAWYNGHMPGAVVFGAVAEPTTVTKTLKLWRKGVRSRGMCAWTLATAANSIKAAEAV